MLMRKSAQQRISETEGAIHSWSLLGLQGDRRISFMSDCLGRLRAGKALSARQRDWLDALIAEGPPVPAGDPVLLSRIDRLRQHLDARRGAALDSLRFTIVSGRTLSEKQAAFLESLLTEAQRVETHGRWTPGAPLRARADFAHSIISSRSGAWKSTHPGTMGAAERYSQWVQDPSAHHIDERTVEKILSACAPALREFDSPKFLEGDLVWLTRSHAVAQLKARVWTMLEPGCTALITGLPVAHEGKVGYPILIDSMPAVVPSEILSRNPAKSRPSK